MNADGVGKSADANADLIKLEQNYRELAIALQLKKEQCDQMRKQLDSADLNSYKLNMDLDRMKRMRKENEHNFNLMMERIRSQELELKELNETLLTTKLSQDMMSIENSDLNKYVEQLVKEKCELKSKLEELEAKDRHFSIFRQLQDECQVEISAKMAEIKQATEKCQAEQEKLLQMLDTIRGHGDPKNLNNFYVEEVKKLRTEKREIEEKLVKLSAKCATFEELMGPIEAGDEVDAGTQLVLVQWKKNLAHHESATNANLHLIRNLSEAVNSEKAANYKLILQNEDREREIEQLQVKCQELLKAIQLQSD